MRACLAMTLRELAKMCWLFRMAAHVDQHLILPPSTYSIGATNWVSVVADAGTVSVVVSYQLIRSPGELSSSLVPPLSRLDFYRSADAGAHLVGNLASARLALRCDCLRIRSQRIFMWLAPRC